jgi:hypothetical protein
MRAFTIKAKSLESAQSLFHALRRFGPALGGNPTDGFFVSVDIGGNDRRILEVLDEIQEHIHERYDAARVELDGREYTVHPERRTHPEER